MRKLFSLLFSLLIIVSVGFSQGKWKYNPYTDNRDYYVEGLSLTTAASGDIIYYNGTIWTRLAKGDNDQVLTLAAGIPSWAAAGGADAFTVKVDAGATAGYFGVAGGDGIFRFTANHFTMADGGDFVTLSLADHATARAALGLAIGTNVVAWDADLDTYAGITPSANIQSYLGAADYAAMRTQLGLVIGTNVLAEKTIGIADNNLLEIDDAGNAADNEYARFTANGLEGRTTANVLSDIGAQASDASLTSIAGLTYVSGSFIALTAEDTYAVRTYAQTLSDIGGQASDAGLTSLAGLVYASDSFIKVTAEDTYAIRTLAETASDLEASIEPTIDTLANLASIQGHTFTLAGDFVTQNNNVTINAVDAARVFTLTEDFTVGDGNAGTLTYSGASKTLTVADDCTVNQNLRTTDDVQFKDVYHTDFQGMDLVDNGNGGASKTIGWGEGNLQKITLDNAGVDITFTEPAHPGPCLLLIYQDATGSRTIDWEHEISPLWPGNVEPTLTTTANAFDAIAFWYIGGTTYIGLFNGDFK